MAEANVTSIEAIEAFRASLIIFIEKATRALQDVSDQVGRARGWVQVDQPNHWRGECGRHKRALEQAEAELFSAKLSSWQDSTAQLKIHAKRCRAALEKAEDKLRQTKRWGRDFDQRVAPLAKKVDALRYQIDEVLPKALVFLDQAAGNLHLYAESFTPSNTPPRDGDETQTGEDT